MIENIWTARADNIREKLIKEGLSYKEIADELNTLFNTDKFTRDAVRGRCRRTNSTSEVVQEPEYRMSFAERWGKFCELIGQTQTELEDKEDPVIGNEFIVLSDLHCPYHNEEALIKIVEQNKGVGTCVVAGDFLDTGSFSPHFAQNKLDVIDEITRSKVVAKYLSDNFDTVVFVLGNHESWFNKAKVKLPKEFQALLKDYLIEYVIADLHNCIFVPEFFTQIGDCVLGHPSMFRQKRMSDVLASYEYFNNWQERLKLNPVRCYVHAHTHKLGSLIVESCGKMVKVFEGGALCLPSEHLSVGHVVNYAPPTEGYIKVVQDEDGNTILNETREYLVELKENQSFCSGVSPKNKVWIE